RVVRGWGGSAVCGGRAWDGWGCADRGERGVCRGVVGGEGDGEAGVRGGVYRLGGGGGCGGGVGGGGGRGGVGGVGRGGGGGVGGGAAGGGGGAGGRGGGGGGGGRVGGGGRRGEKWLCSRQWRRPGSGTAKETPWHSISTCL
ncbi:hypothetical protein HGQ98_29620, partial [Achromobacter ruhlandii]|nr:hypothetical protein [Achromobacter ruhlandii]